MTCSSPRTVPNSEVTMTAGKNVLHKAINGAGWLFGLSALQKIASFMLNILVLRNANVNVVGAATVQFELLLSSSLFLRDGFRLGLLRSSGIDANNGQNKYQIAQLVNISWLITIVGVVVGTAITFFTIFLYGASNSSEIHGWSSAVGLYGIAVIIEWSVEPMYLMAHASLYFKWRVISEAVAFILRATVLYICAIWLQYGIIAYGVAQVFYSLGLLVTYAYFFMFQCHCSTIASKKLQLRQLFPVKLADQEWIHRPMLKLCGVLTLQSVLKHILTEGDKLVLTMFASHYDMGVYSVAFNIGSLVPRMIFLPIEEASKAIFSKTLGSQEMTCKNEKDDNLVYDTLFLLVKATTYVGFLFACFGSNFTDSLLCILLGFRKMHSSSIPSVLSWYCCYILFLAVNGVLEAFVHTTGSGKDLMNLNGLLLCFFAAYASAVYIFMRLLDLGTVGLILANCVNMWCRIVYSFYFIYSRARFSIKDLGKMLPHQACSLYFVMAWFFMYLSKLYFIQSKATNSVLHHVQHICIGVVVLVGAVCICYSKERAFIRKIRETLVLSNKKHG